MIKKSTIVGMIIFIGIILIAMLAVITLIHKDTEKQNADIINKIYNMYHEEVDGGVQYFMNSKEYTNMSKDEKIHNMDDLLSIYEEYGIIKNLYYDESSLMYTFVYNHGDIQGALGGVSLRDWNPMMN